MKKTFSLLMIGTFFNAAATAADTYTIDSRHTFPSFEISHLGFSVQRGRFNHTTGKVRLDPETGKGSMRITVDAASISTGLAELEEHLRGEDFFDVAHYPDITFTSDQLQFNNKRLVAVNGNLTIHGITKPVMLRVDHYHCGLNMISMKNVCGANAVASIKRSDFGVDKYAPMLADDVKIIIQVEAIKD